MDLTGWHERLARAERDLGLRDGFKFLFCPASTMRSAKVAFLSQKPGRPPNAANLRTVSDERGNSYEVEARTTVSPITEQFLRFCRFVGVRPSDVLTGVASPFRAAAWADLSPAQQAQGLALGREFWDKPLRSPQLRLVVAVSQEAADLVVDVMDAKPLDVLGSGWGSYSIRRFQANRGALIVHLPHLSRFKLFGRPASEAFLRDAFAD